ncbi:MAG: hypothetical protein INQ03_18665 [Candidatus Heimdallarchaeota archaeon]|nr:hypothetical protein [Candidatus Heimdallarchaeota archaeon]
MKDEAPADVDIPDSYLIDFVEMSDGAKLRRLYSHPENPKGTVLIYPGMNTLVLSWVKILVQLRDLNYKVEYVESREKYTAILEKHHEISKERMLLDNSESIQAIGLNGTDYIAVGSSLGSCTLIHNLARKSIDTPKVILLGPLLEIKVHLSIRILMYFINDWLFRNVGVKIVKKMIIRRYTNEKADPMQKRKYQLALELAEFNRLKTALRKWLGSKIEEDLPLIDGEKSHCYLIGASEDVLHPDTETIYIADNIPNAEYIDLKTNSAAHDTPLVEFIESIV